MLSQIRLHTNCDQGEALCACPLQKVEKLLPTLYRKCGNLHQPLCLPFTKGRRTCSSHGRQGLGQEGSKAFRAGEQVAAGEGRWPNLAKMVKQYFAAPASSAGVERLFSAAGKMHDDLKKSSNDSLEASLFAMKNTD